MSENTPAGGGPTLTWSQSVNRLREIETELTRLAELDTLSDEDDVYFRELTEEFDRVDAHRQRLERDAELGRIRSAASKINVKGTSPLRPPVPQTSGQDEYDRDAFLEPDSVADARFRNPWDIGNVRTFGRSREEVGQELRARALSAIEVMPGASDRVREAATKIVETYDDKHSTISKMVLASSSPAYLRAFAKAAQGQESSWSVDERQAVEQVRAMSLTDADGGFLVPFQLDPTVIVTSVGSRNDIRQIARQVVATGDKWNGVSSTAVSWSWDAESVTATPVLVSDDTTTFAQPHVDIYKAQGFVPISVEALMDEPNVGASVATLLAFGRDTLEAAAFVTGNGTTEPRGIVTAIVAAGGSSVKTSATADTFAIADLYTVQGSLPARYRRNAAWLGNNLTYNKVRQFDTNGGAGLWTTLGNDRPPQLLGRGVYESEDMDGVINAGSENYLLLFGAFENYVIADRIGMTVEFIPHMFQQAVAGTALAMPTSQRGWLAYYRVGADSVNDGAFRLLNVT